MNWRWVCCFWWTFLMFRVSHWHSWLLARRATTNNNKKRKHVPSGRTNNGCLILIKNLTTTRNLCVWLWMMKAVFLVDLVLVLQLSRLRSVGNQIWHFHLMADCFQHGLLNSQKSLSFIKRYQRSVQQNEKRKWGNVQSQQFVCRSLFYLLKPAVFLYFNSEEITKNAAGPLWRNCISDSSVMMMMAKWSLAGGFERDWPTASFVLDLNSRKEGFFDEFKRPGYVNCKAANFQNATGSYQLQSGRVLLCWSISQRDLVHPLISITCRV